MDKQEREYNSYNEWRSHNKYFGKKFSILGDSISTLGGYNPKDYDVYYDGYMCRITEIKTKKDTWWGAVIDFFGGELLVNDAYSGSCVTGTFHPAGSSDRRTGALHYGNVQPDVILVYLGVNDYGSYIHVNSFDKAYNTMLSKIKSNYPDTEVWCFALCPGYLEGEEQRVEGAPFGEYNDSIRSAAAKNACYVIDAEKYQTAYMSIDGFHPDREGMMLLASMAIHEMDKEAAGSFFPESP
jgi:lysophospholipase L1-like esterase